MRMMKSRDELNKVEDEKLLKIIKENNEEL